MILDRAGQRIHIATWGEHGPMVVLLHSSGMSSAQWRRLAERLAPTHRVLAPDFIGYGASSPWAGPGPSHFTHDARVAAAVMAHVNEPVHLVGHSYGGLCGLTAAWLEAPFVQLASIVAYEPVAFGVLYSAHDAEGLADVARREAEGGDLFAPELEGTIYWFEKFVDYWSGPGAWQRLSKERQEAFISAGRKTFQECRSLAHDRTPHQAYAHIEAPVLLLHGSESPVAAQRIARVLAGALPHARVERIAGAGHLGPLTHVDAVNDRIVAAIASAAPPS